MVEELPANQLLGTKPAQREVMAGSIIVLGASAYLQYTDDANPGERVVMGGCDQCAGAKLNRRTLRSIRKRCG